MEKKLENKLLYNYLKMKELKKLLKMVRLLNRE